MNQQTILNYFQVLKQHNMVAQAYLFLGGQQSVVMDIVKMISCQQQQGFCGQCWDCKMIDRNSHPDLHVITAQATMIKIEQIREGQQFLMLRSFRLPRKILLIESAQLLSHEAANAFLKTLEEPPQSSFIGLLAPHQQGLLPTIISRCRKVILPGVADTVDKKRYADVSKFIAGKDIVFKDRTQFKDFIVAAVTVFRDQLISHISGSNKKLLKSGSCEIIVPSCGPEKLCEIIDVLCNIYSRADTANQKLALKLLRQTMI